VACNTPSKVVIYDDGFWSCHHDNGQYGHTVADAYSRTTQDLLEHVQDIADEQGSASAKVVFEDYLTDERKRELRREFIRENLASAFGGP
jgi:GTPase Era involved in 16S rRNA processing